MTPPPASSDEDSDEDSPRSERDYLPAPSRVISPSPATSLPDPEEYSPEEYRGQGARTRGGRRNRGVVR